MQDTAGEAGTSSQGMYSNGPPHMAWQKQDDQLEHTFSSYVGIRDVALKTCQRRWTIGRSGERGSGISVLAARHDDDDTAHIQRLWHKKVYQYVHSLKQSNTDFNSSLCNFQFVFERIVAFVTKKMIAKNACVEKMLFYHQVSYLLTYLSA